MTDVKSDDALYSVQVQRWQAGKLAQVEDVLAEEVPVALVYNGVSHAVMMASPQDLEDFALGFSLTEGILQSPKELYGVELEVHENQGISVYMEIASERFVQLKEHRRNLTGRTGCGLCGAERLEQVFKQPSQLVTHTPSNIGISAILNAFEQLPSKQALQKITGATHACAWVDEQGKIGLLREDVGRHNAMDKLLGALAKQGYPTGFILTTSRASYEMVQKVAMLGYGCLAAVSAPTGLAVRLANEMQVTLLGFVRGQQCVIYSHAERIKD
jgi:FdhD protein